MCGAPEGANTQHLLQCKALPPDLLRKRARAAAQRGVIRRDALLAQRDDPGTPDEPRRKRPSPPADPRPKQGGHKGKRCQAPQTGPRKKPKIQLDAWDWEIEDAYRLDWPCMNSATLAAQLWWFGHAIDVYLTRRQIQLDCVSTAETSPGVPYKVGLSQADFEFYCSG